MNLLSKQDSDSIRKRFFEAVGGEFAKGASVKHLTDVSLEMGVWDEVKDQLVEEGIQRRISTYIRTAKDPLGRRIYHSIDGTDEEGNPVDLYKPVGLFNVEDYKCVLKKMEKRIGDHVAIYLDLVSQAEERYGYQHPLPFEVLAYKEAVERQVIEESQQDKEAA